MAEPNEHFELEPRDAGNAEPKTPPSGSPPPRTPTPPASSGTVGIPPTPVEEKVPSLLELAEDKCPKCGTVLRPDAVFCVKCGYDMRTNEVRGLHVGVEHVEEKPKTNEDARVFSTEGRGNAQLLLGIGAALTVAAMVVSGLNAPPKFWPVVASVLLSLYETVLHTGTGIVAVLIAARFNDMKAGRLDLALARIFVAFAAFQVLHQISFGEYKLLVTLLMYPVALAAYWGVIMLLFRKPRMVAATVMIAHFLLWIIVTLGMELSGYVSRVEANTVVVKEQVPAEPPPAP